MNKLRIAILFFLTTLKITSTGWSATYYVDGGKGNDANPGTETYAWKTINKANETLQAGDIVYLRAGVYYADYINPIRSGTSDTNRITYSNYSNESVTIRDASYGIRINGKSYITVNGINFYNLDHFFHIENNANYNTIQYCTFDSMRTYTWAGSRIWNNSKYNQLRHNSLSKWGTLSSGDNGTVLDIGNWSVSNDFSDYNLIEDNTFYAGGHHLFGAASSFNVIRNNYFHHEPWTSCSRGKCGNRNIITEGYRARFNLYEGNTIAFASWPPDDYGASGITVSSPQNIIRLNKFYYNDSAGIEISNQSPFANADGNHVYNNIFYHNGYNLSIPSSYRMGLYFANWGGATSGNAIKNNIFHNNQNGAINYGSSSPTLQYVEGNWLEGGDPNFVNISSPPNPQNQALYDFRLQSSSPAIDSGVFLTSTTSAGTGYTLPVVDPYYFMDGWGILDIKGDTIQLEGQTKTVQITKVNYDLKTVTVDTPLTWTKGQGVSLAYLGNRPDIGAYEYGASRSLSGLTISGPASLNGSSSETYVATAAWSDGTTSTVTPVWSENSTYATISTAGILTTSAVTANQTVTVSASFTSGAVTKTAAMSVSIIYVYPAITLSGLTISGPASLNGSSSGTYVATVAWSDGTTSTVTPVWSENSTYATISTAGILTTSAVTANQTVTVSASYTSGAVTKTAAMSVSIIYVSPAKTLSGLTISGPASLNGSSSGTYVATAAWSDGTTSTVTPVWSENSTYATISTAGILTTSAVTANQTVTVSASYTSGAVTKTAAMSVSIIYVSPAKTLSGLTISGPASLNGSSSGTYVATAAWSDGTTSTATPVWSENSAYATISTAGILTTSAVTANQTVTVSASYTSGAVTKAAAMSVSILYAAIATTQPQSSVLFFRAESGALTTDTMKIVTALNIPGGSYITPTSSTSSSAVYDFNIIQPGNYKIVAEVYSADAGSDSFIVKIDNGPEDIWDLNPSGDPALYSIWRQDEVTARGMGTFNAPQFDPLIVKLAAGPHKITISGRELNSRLAYFYILMTPSVTKVIEAESGTITAQMQVILATDASGGAYISTSTSNSGSAVYNFNIDQPGNYKIVANVYSADAGSDSFLVKIDNGPQEIWDLNPTVDPALYNIWRQDEVNARGTGTPDAPEFDPLTVQLATGNHTITFSGREKNARLDNFHLIQKKTEPEIYKIEIN